MTGRLAAWTIELSQFFIEYKPRTMIKSQVLLDFVAEYRFKCRAPRSDENQSRPWLLFIDGSSTADSGGAGIILISPEGFKIQQALKFEFPAINNVAEYEALIAGLKLAVDLEAEIIDIFEDSQMTPRSSTGETPFRLAYGVDAVLPVEEKTAKDFNKKVKARSLKVDDLVLRDSAASQPIVSGKFKPTWEGPYRVSKVISAGTYELAHLDGQPIKNACNGIHLKKFYQ
ncbi:uncharacterized protein LOC141684969 [Apium graveolens]|uniref:uncharacterized protein LOC141684969 n=1 Tax=Apium graveolens TaxID=4045 RepID=UPI003D7B6E1C